ncbi:MAG: S9 family peptidase [Myxococcales bacterium]|nr:S9 family peptidase [Myxococcales bacterium]
MRRGASFTIITIALGCVGSPGCGGSPTPEMATPPVAAPPAVPAAEGPLHGGKAPREDTSLTPREVFFGNPDRTGVQISPDGKQLAYLAPHNGVLNVWVAPLADPKNAEVVTHDQKRGIRRFHWAYTSQHLVYLQDQAGDENWRAYAVDLKKAEVKDLTPLPGVRAELVHASPKTPTAMVIGLNDRDERLHDLYRVDLTTGDRKLIEKNEGGFVGYVVDDDFRAKLALAFTPKGGLELKTHNAKGAWETLVAVGPEDSLATSPVGLDRGGNKLLLQDSRGRDKSALVELSLATKQAEMLYEGKKADVSGVMRHPTTKKVQAVAETFERTVWTAIDPAVKVDLDKLDAALEGDVEVVSKSLDDLHWIVAESRDDGPRRYHHYDRKKKTPTFLFVDRDSLEGVPLTKMHPRVIPSRDGLELVSYLSLPKTSDPDLDGKPAAPLPMVLFVHGGPWGRDDWGYHPYHQWLASRGYAVLSVNYRGSTGLGKRFTNLANGEWAGKMHDDLIDAVGWAVKEQVAVPDKVAIMGGSYGGYATLVGLTFTPKQFACGVDIVGPSNLVTLLENIPPYWAPFRPILTERVGDPTTAEGKRFLLERSPLSRVDAIERPLLIAQGANDPRVKQQESDQIVQAMKAKGIGVVYVLYPDEGHGFARPENRKSFSAVSEIFLAQCLGGSYQPIGDDFAGSSVTVPEGAQHVWGLSDKLPK